MSASVIHVSCNHYTQDEYNQQHTYRTDKSLEHNCASRFYLNHHLHFSVYYCQKKPILYVQTKLENPLPSECIRVSEQGYHINGRASCIMTKILMQFKYSINHQSSCCNIRVEYLILVNL
jgi:hypothetical protein